MVLISAARARLDRDDQKKADMWSFAVLFWEMVTGQIPHEGVPPMLIGIKVRTLHSFYWALSKRFVPCITIT